MAKSKNTPLKESPWIEVGNGYALALKSQKLICRNAAGEVLTSLPKVVRESEVADQLRSTVEFLELHKQACLRTVETWMVRSLPIPTPVIQALWEDSAWKKVLENTVVIPIDDMGQVRFELAGLLRGIDLQKGLGLVNLDGETGWTSLPAIVIPHPILLPELNDFRELLVELNIKQGIEQVFREIWVQPADLPPQVKRLDTYANGKFTKFGYVWGRCRKLGFRLQAGQARCPIWENGHLIEARYTVGDASGSWIVTGNLEWVDEQGRNLKMSDLGPVAFSEGNRMAALIYAARKIDASDASQSQPTPGQSQTSGTIRKASHSIALSPEAALHAGGLILPGAMVPDSVRVDGVSARRYRHRALPGRVITRLVADILAPGVDREMEVFGFDLPEVLPEIARQRRRAIGFPGWALIHDLEHASFALDVVKEMRQHTKTAQLKKSVAMEGFENLGIRLGRSVPHFLPSYFEEVGRVFIELGSPTLGAQYFQKARQAEEIYALPIDEAQHQETFLEFALAGALRATALSKYTDQLGKKYGPVRAYESFRELCIKRIIGGLPPWGGMAKRLRTLAKEAGLDAGQEDHILLEQILESSVMHRAPLEFWRAYRTPLVTIAKRSPRIRGFLLNLFPGSVYSSMEFHIWWLEFLDDGGALEALWLSPESVLPETAPDEGAAGWFKQALTQVSYGWKHYIPLQLFQLLRQMAPRLIREGISLSLVVQSQGIDIDLLDLALELGIPVSDPAENIQLRWENWLNPPQPSEFQRDPVFVTQDPRFFPLIEKSVDSLITDSEAFRTLSIGKRALETVRRAWFVRQLKVVETGLLLDIESALQRLSKVASPEIWNEFPEILDRLKVVNLATGLGRTLRAGILDELGWPDLEAAVADLPVRQHEELVFQGAFPYLVVSNQRQAIVIGPPGRVGRFDLRFPVRVARFVDGQLLVVNYDNGKWNGYWSHEPATIFTVSTLYDTSSLEGVGVPVPGGGITFGGRVVRIGDTEPDISVRANLLFDGSTFWRYQYVEEQGAYVYQEFNPQTGEEGRASVPTFIEEFKIDGATIDFERVRLFPLPNELEGTLLGRRDGMAGWRVRKWTDLQKPREYEGIDGRSLRQDLGNSAIQALLTFPGCKDFHAVASHYYDVTIWNLAESGRIGDYNYSSGANTSYARGTFKLVPPVWWHFFKVRDEVGSLALRQVSDETAHRLFDLGVENLFNREADLQQRLDSLVENLPQYLPELTHANLKRGVAGIILEAATLNTKLHRLVSPPNPAPVVEAENLDLIPFPLDARVNLALKPFGIDSTPNQGKVIGKHIGEISDWFRAAYLGNEDELEKLETLSLTWSDFHFIRLMGKIGAPAFVAAVNYQSFLDGEQVHCSAILDFLEGWATTIFADDSLRFRFFTGTCTGDGEEGTKWQKPGSFWTFQQQGSIYFTRVAREWRVTEYKMTFSALELTTTGEFNPLHHTITHQSVPITGWSGTERIRTLVELVRQRGSIPWDETIAQTLSQKTGLSRAAAILLWFGCLHFDVSWYESNFLPQTFLTQFGLKKGAASAAREEELRAECSIEESVAMYTGIMPEAVETLWHPLGTGPDDETSLVSRLACAWNDRFGRRLPISDALRVMIQKKLRGVPFKNSLMLSLISTPETSGYLRTDVIWEIQSNWSYYSNVCKAIRPLLPDEHLFNPDWRARYFSNEVATAVAHWLPFLFENLPVGDPLRTNCAEVFKLTLERLKNPEFLVDLGLRRISSQNEGNIALRAFGDTPYAGFESQPVDGLTGRDSGAMVAYVKMQPTGDSGYFGVCFRPAMVTDFEALTRLSRSTDFIARPHHIGVLKSAGMAAMAERIRSTPVPAGQWEPNPFYSAPELLAEVKTTLALSEDAAMVYLQVLALAEPTTSNLKKWNGWETKRIKKAVAELVAKSLLVEAKRPRAGRTFFLPGGWTVLTGANLPLETWKLPLYAITWKTANTYTMALHHVLPLRPHHELFAQAWERVKAGNRPGYEAV